MDRRDFIKQLGLKALLPMSLGAFSSEWAWAKDNQQPLISLLHTNDTHSRVDPFISGSYKGLGGISRRATLIQQLKRKNPHTLVLDSGDIFQGTPYFNLFKGRIELETMSRAGYQFSAMGNHDFDLGVDWFLTAAHKYARFPFLCANLQFTNPLAEKKILPYTIQTLQGKKVGLVGLCVRLKGLVAEKLWSGVRYLDPIQVTKQIVQRLREQHQCDIVVVLSHLGYTGYEGEPGDMDLARSVPGIDIILGGHTHTFLLKPVEIKAPDGKTTHIFQVGHSGIFLGQIDMSFSSQGQLLVRSQNHLIHA